MTTAEILEAATPRPWEQLTPSSDIIQDVAQMVGQPTSRGGHMREQANAAYIVLAVNAYERDQRITKALTEALALLIEDVGQYEAWQRPCFALDKACAALALAKEATK